jgi:hypothetical protein
VNASFVICPVNGIKRGSDVKMKRLLRWLSAAICFTYLIEEPKDVCGIKDLLLFSLKLVLEIFFAPISNQRVAVKIREELSLGLRAKCRFFVCSI